jgi:protein phosphatase
MQALQKAFLEANLCIHTRGQQNREFMGMGTTGTALVIGPQGAWIGHVGDSRCYRIRGGKIEQLTFDHSLVWELARRQNKAPEELAGVPTNVIVRSLGSAEVVQVDVEGPHPILPGDSFLLCSDGLSGQVSDREIGSIVANLPPEEACRFLINLANLQGGPDNITAIVVHVAGRAATEAPSANGAPPDAVPVPRPSVVTRLAPHVKQFLKRLPWPLILLILGIILAMVAIYLTAFDRKGDLLTFVAAAVALLAGLRLLMAQNPNETAAAPPKEPEPDVPRVYRSTACGIEPAVVGRLVQAVAALEERIKERNWELNPEDWQGHRDKGRLLESQGDLPGAFREDSRAMLLLMETISKQRNKKDLFQPLWDKAPAYAKGFGAK